MDLSDRVLSALAAQLGHPRGLHGRVVGRLLNRTNKAATTGAVHALDLPDDGVAADLGFGGGAGLDLLLRRLGPAGRCTVSTSPPPCSARPPTGSAVRSKPVG